MGVRVLVVGTVPPPGGISARRFATVAAARLAAGDEVTVLSPDLRSAAHRSGSLKGLALVAQLLRRAPRHDALVLRIEPQLPLSPETGRAMRSVVFLSLGLVLRRYDEVTVRLDSPIPLPGGVGGRATSSFWAAVDQVVVQSEEDRLLVEQVPELEASQILVEQPDDALSIPATRQWPSATDTGLRELVQSEVRRVALEEGRLRAARRELGASSIDSSSAFAESARVRPSLQGLAQAAVGVSRRRGAALVRRQWAALAGSRSR